MCECEVPYLSRPGRLDDDHMLCDLLTSFLIWLIQEQEFLQKQQQDLDSALKKIIQQHKHELATIERDCLNHKQQLLRGKRSETDHHLRMDFKNSFSLFQRGLLV